MEDSEKTTDHLQAEYYDCMTVHDDAKDWYTQIELAEDFIKALMKCKPLSIPSESDTKSPRALQKYMQSNLMPLLDQMSIYKDLENEEKGIFLVSSDVLQGIIRCLIIAQEEMNDKIESYAYSMDRIEGILRSRNAPLINLDDFIDPEGNG
jgi:hypothetical protein